MSRTASLSATQSLHDRACGSFDERAVAGWRIQVWASAASGSRAASDSFDFGSADTSGPVGRFVVADAAVAPWHDTEVVRQRGHMVLGALSGPGDLVEGLKRAERLTVDPAARKRHDSPIFSVAVCDVEWSSGDVRAISAGDCEVWVRHQGDWISLFPEDMLTEQARLMWQVRSAGLAEDARWALQRTLLEDETAWRCPPIGLGVGRYAVCSASDVEAVIVSSDGARLHERACGDLEEWLQQGIHHRDPASVLPHPHGDICVMAATRL